jgi:hypothetical protein
MVQFLEKAIRSLSSKACGNERSRPVIKKLGFILGMAGFWVIVMLLLFSLAAPARAAGTDRYVSNAGADSGDCSGSPCATFAYAIGQASGGDTIHISSGSYAESFTLDKAVSLVGISSDTVALRPTASGQRILLVDGATITNSTVISGITFADGQLGTVSGYGGGIRLQNSSQPLFQNVTITNCTAYKGAGIYADAACPLTIVDSLIISNTCGQIGGGVFGGDVLSLEGCWIMSNTSEYVGAGVHAAGTADVDGCTFQGNWGMSGGNNCGGGLRAQGAVVVTDTAFVDNVGQRGGGGAYCSSWATFTGCRFEGNQAPGFVAGALQILGALTLSDCQFIRNENGTSSGGAIFSGDPGSTAGQAVSVRGCLFENNTGNTGGAIYNRGPLIVEDSVFVGNRSRVENGGAINSNKNVKLTGTRFENNRTGDDDYGGALYVSNCADITDTQFISNSVDPDEDGGGLGGAFVCNSCNNNMRWINLIVADNRGNSQVYASVGAGVDVLHATVTDGSTGLLLYGNAHFTNTIVANNSIGLNMGSGSAVLTDTLWYSNALDYSGSVIHALDRSGDPGFVDPDSGNYHIGPNSAGMDQGVDAGVTWDIDGDSRPMGSAPDLGADEIEMRSSRMPLVLKGY